MDRFTLPASVSKRLSQLFANAAPENSEEEHGNTNSPTPKPGLTAFISPRRPPEPNDRPVLPRASTPSEPRYRPSSVLPPVSEESIKFENQQESNADELSAPTLKEVSNISLEDIDPPTEAAAIAMQVKKLIQEPIDHAESAARRELNMLLCAAGGKNYFDKIPHPEAMAFAGSLSALPDDERLEYLSALHRPLESCLPRRQKEMVSRYIDEIGRHKHPGSFITLNNRLQVFRRALTDAIETVYPAAILASDVKGLIARNKDEKQHGTIRALKIFYAAAGGTIPSRPEQPESLDHAKILSNHIWHEERLEYVRHLHDSLNSYLTLHQKAMIKTYLASYKNSNDALEDFKQNLEDQLNKLDVGQFVDDGSGGKYFLVL